jgi:hypothetical protein
VPGGAAVSHGLSRTSGTIDLGRCQRVARLAHPGRLRRAADLSGPCAVCPRGLGARPVECGLCAGFDDHRPVPGAVSVGEFPRHQGGGEDAYIARLEGQYSQLSPYLSDGTLHDVHALDLLTPEPGAIYVMVRGYLNFTRLHDLHLAGAFFVTRAKSNLKAHRVYSMPTDRKTGIVCDQRIALAGFYAKQDYPAHLRRVRFNDLETGKTLVFLSNQMTLPAATICALYTNRWQVELFFKWIKQHLQITWFFGTSENAVKSQIWIAASVSVLVAIVKKRLNLDASLYTLLQILSVTMFEKMTLQQAFPGRGHKAEQGNECNQPNLFAF